MRAVVTAERNHVFERDIVSDDHQGARGSTAMEHRALRHNARVNPRCAARVMLTTPQTRPRHNVGLNRLLGPTQFWAVLKHEARNDRKQIRQVVIVDCSTSPFAQKVP